MYARRVAVGNGLTGLLSALLWTAWVSLQWCEIHPFLNFLINFSGVAIQTPVQVGGFALHIFTAGNYRRKEASQHHKGAELCVLAGGQELSLHQQAVNGWSKRFVVNWHLQFMSFPCQMLSGSSVQPLLAMLWFWLDLTKPTSGVWGGNNSWCIHTCVRVRPRDALLVFP